jgi:hypothetical protein
MLDIELIRTDPEYVRAPLLKRTDDGDLDPILEATLCGASSPPRSTPPAVNGTGRPRRSAS